MSAETIRRGATAIRADHEPWHEEGDPPCDHPSCENDRFMRAVADLLQWQADLADLNAADGAREPGMHPTHPALAVARAYLGEA